MTFEDVKRIRENPLMDDIDNKELHKMIDVAIEKQISKKPLEENRYYGNGKCPNCGAVFLDKSTHYCGNCGQALDWS